MEIKDISNMVFSILLGALLGLTIGITDMLLETPLDITALFS